jgi:nucleotide-binding universal stress UspA family protein
VNTPIVLCTDGSDASNRALAAGLAVLDSAVDVVIVSVADEADPMLLTGTGTAGGTMSPDDFDRLVRDLEAEAENAVRATAAFLDRGDATTRVLPGGSAGASLCEFAQEVSARALVLGTRGRGGIKRALLGSVSDFVVRNAPCPVVVTGDMSTSPAGESFVLCVDGSDAAMQAVDAGRSLLEPAKRLLVVTVVEETDPTPIAGPEMPRGVVSGEEFIELDSIASAEGWATAEREAERLAVDDPELHVLLGDPGPVLCAFARESHARAIVMGSRGHGAIKRALLGSVSDYVVRNAPCPVVIANSR